MKISGSGKHTGTWLTRQLLRALLMLLALSALAVFALKVYLDTPHAAALLSRLLTTRLHQPVSIARVHTAGGSFILNGISVANPAGMFPGNLVEADSLTIAPSWADLLLGRRHVRRLALSGLRLDIRRTAAGVWNFSELHKRFSATKPAGEELFIDQFSLSNGALLVNGQGVTGVALRLSNLSTKGSGDARIELSFEDAVRNRFTISGAARPGSAPAFQLALAAPSLSFSGLYGMLNRKADPLLDGLNGGLTMTANLQDRELRVAGKLEFTRTPLHSASTVPSIAGSLNFAATYDTARDEAHLDEMKLTVNDLIRAYATGAVDSLKHDRRFRVEIRFERVELAGLAALLPESERRKTIIGGAVSGTSLQLSGNGGQGVTRAVGMLQLRDGSFEREGQLYVKGLAANLAFSRAEAGFLVSGKLSSRGQSGRALLETLDAPLAITLSRRMRVIMAEMPALAASSRGMHVTGRLGFVPAASNPLTIALRMSVPTVSSLQPLVGKGSLRLVSGGGSLSLDATGRGLNDFNAAVTARVSGLQGAQGGREIGLKHAGVDSRFSRQNGKISVSGTAALDGVALNGKRGEARFAFRFEDGAAVVENARIGFDGAALAIARIDSRVYPKEIGTDAVRYPLRVAISGAELQRGAMGVNGVSCTVRGSFATDAAGSWLDGTADLSAARVAWQGKPVAAPALHATLSRAGLRAAVSGMLLGGSFSGDAAINPASPDKGGGFQLGIRGVRLSRVQDLLPRRGAAALNEGTLDASISGRYSPDRGVASRFDLQGTGISMAGGHEKTLLSGAGFTLAGELNGADLVISNALVKAGEGVSLRLKGEVKKPFDVLREGRIAFSMQRTPLAGIIDQFVNMLPRFIQEASVDGSVATEGAIVLHDGKQLLEGALQFTNVLFEVQSQKLKAEEISGSLPFSLDVSGKTTYKTPETADFSRENYARLLGELAAKSDNGQLLRIGSVSFGSLDLGEVLLRTSVVEGVTRLVSLRSSLYEGAVLGTGFVVVKNGINYRVDLLINGLSLKRFCATIPKIRDYISGRVDGVISLNGAGKGVAGITGFTELWAREGPGEKMLVSKTFLQKLSGKQLSGFFFRSDRTFDQAEISAVLQDGYLTFDKLDISNTNLFGIRDLKVEVAPSQNRIALDHLLDAVKQAAVRGKAAVGEAAPAQAPAEPEFRWQE